MEEDILSFINKLPPTESLPPLRQGGLRVESKIKELEKRLPTLEPNKVISLGIFLQHLELSLFTDRELIAVASKRLDLLSSNPNDSLPTSILPETGLVDTGSYRLMSLLHQRGISISEINYMVARSNRNNYDLLSILED